METNADGRKCKVSATTAVSILVVCVLIGMGVRFYLHNQQ